MDDVESLRQAIEDIAASDKSPEITVLQSVADRARSLVSKNQYDIDSPERDWLEIVLPVLLRQLGLREADRPTKPRIERDGMPGHVAFFFGRAEEKQKLNDWLADDSKRIAELTGAGGYGKTQLVNNWLLETLADERQPPPFAAVFCWCFYTFSNRAPVTYNEFLTKAIRFFEEQTGRSELIRNEERHAYLANLISSGNYLVVLDGLEALQKRPKLTQEERDEGDETLEPGQFRRRFTSMKRFLQAFAARASGKLLITSRQPVNDLANDPALTTIRLKGLDEEASVQILRRVGARGSDRVLRVVANAVGFHPLTLGLFGYCIGWGFGGVSESIGRIGLRDANFDERLEYHEDDIIRSYRKWLQDSAEMEFLRLVGFFHKRMIPLEDLEFLVREECLAGINSKLRETIQTGLEKGSGINRNAFHKILSLLGENGLLLASTETQDRDVGPTTIKVYDVHPLLRSFFRDQLIGLEKGKYWREGQKALFHRYQQQVMEAANSRPDVELLYEAIGYACEAGLLEEAFDTYWRRVHRNTKSLSDPDWFARPVWYARDVLGMYSEDLSATGWFYEHPWQQLRADLKNQDQQNVIRYATAECLKVLAYSVEAGHPINSIRSSFENQDQFRLAAITAGWESERRLIQGKFDDAKKAGEQALELAKRSNDKRQLLSKHGRLGDYYLQIGDWEQANRQFEQVRLVHQEILGEQKKSKVQPIGGFTGFLYADYVLTRAETILAGWDTEHRYLGENNRSREEVCSDLQAVSNDARRIVDDDELDENLADRILHNFVFLRATAIENIWINEPTDVELERLLNEQLAELESEFEIYARSELPRLLVKRSKVLRRLRKLGDSTTNGEDTIQLAYGCLNRALDIAKYGEMLVYEADVFLEQSKVFHYESEFAETPETRRKAFETACDICKQARSMIEKMGYRKRLPELEKLEQDLKLPRR